MNYKPAISARFIFRLTVLALPAIWLAMTGQARAMETLRYVSAPGKSLVQIFGTSTLHDWSAQGKVINGSLAFMEDLQAKLHSKDKAFPLVEAEHIELDFRIPIKSLKSDTEGLDDEMYKSLDCQKHPDISFSFVSAAFVSHPKDKQYVFNAKGVLNINGVSQPHDMPITVSHVSKGRLFISTETAVKMTDFKITPPTFLGGLLEAGDQVKIKVKWDLELAKPSPGAG